MAQTEAKNNYTKNANNLVTSRQGFALNFVTNNLNK